MSEFVEVFKAAELKDGIMTAVSVAGREILLARVGGKYYAADNYCPHMRGNLSQGKLQGTIVTCPRHGSQFDLSDGHVIHWTNWSGLVSAVSKLARSPRPLTIYNVKVEADRVLVEI